MFGWKVPDQDEKIQLTLINPTIVKNPIQYPMRCIFCAKLCLTLEQSLTHKIHNIVHESATLPWGPHSY